MSATLLAGWLLCSMAVAAGTAAETPEEARTRKAAEAKAETDALSRLNDLVMQSSFGVADVANAIRARTSLQTANPTSSTIREMKAEFAKGLLPESGSKREVGVIRERDAKLAGRVAAIKNLSLCGATPLEDEKAVAAIEVLAVAGDAVVDASFGEIVDAAHATLVATGATKIAAIATQCAAELKPKRALEAARVVDTVASAVRGWEARAAAAQTYGKDGGLPMPLPQQVYQQARAARESVDKLLAEAKDELRIAIAEARAKGEWELDAEDLLGDDSSLDSTALRTAEMNKSIGGGAIPASVAEGLQHIAKYAVKRAKRQAIGMVHDQLARQICRLEWKDPPLVDAGKAEPAATGGAKLFPKTCDLVKSTSLTALVGDPRRLQPALVDDLLVIASTHAIERALPSADAAQRAQVAGIVRSAVAALGRVRSVQLPKPSHKDAETLLTHALRAVRKTPDAWKAARHVPIALEAVAAYAHLGGRRDLAKLLTTIVEGVTTKPEDQAKLLEQATPIALLGLRALGVSRDPSIGDEHEGWVAAIEVVMSIAVEYEKATSTTKPLLPHVQRLAVAVADENIPEALTVAAALLTARAEAELCAKPKDWEDNVCIPACKRDAKCEDACAKRKGAYAYARALPHRMSRAVALLSGAATYGATYAVALQQGKSEAELRAARAEALENLVEQATRRSSRQGDWVVSLGLPVGFSAGGQWIRRFGKDFDKDEANDTLSCGSARHRDDPDCDVSFDDAEWMTPQLELPLGLAVQRLPGRSAAGGRGRRRLDDPKKHTEDRWYFDGIHAFASLFDLGQFAAYETDGGTSVSRPRWDSVISPGVQLGWAVGRPQNMLIAGLSFRYAPTLFASTGSVLDRDDAFGALRLGLALAYYVSIFDFT